MELPLWNIFQALEYFVSACNILNANMPLWMAINNNERQVLCSHKLYLTINKLQIWYLCTRCMMNVENSRQNDGKFSPFKSTVISNNIVRTLITCYKMSRKIHWPCEKRTSAFMHSAHEDRPALATGAIINKNGKSL